MYCVQPHLDQNCQRGLVQAAGFTAPTIHSRCKSCFLFLGHSVPALNGSANDFVPIDFLRGAFLPLPFLPLPLLPLPLLPLPLLPLPLLPLPLLHLPFVPLPFFNLAEASFARLFLAGRSGSRTFKIAFHIQLLCGFMLAAPIGARPKTDEESWGAEQFCSHLAKC